jgi:hypothetical protein
MRFNRPARGIGVSRLNLEINCLEEYVSPCLC